MSLIAGAKKELTLVEQRLQDVYVDRIDPKLDCILVIFPSIYSPTVLIRQRENNIVEWIFLAYKQNKKLKMHIEKVSKIIIKGRIRSQFSETVLPEIVVPLTNAEIVGDQLRLAKRL